MSKKLGRGLSALIPDYSNIKEEVLIEDKNSLKEIAINLIVNNKFQPRMTFNTESINDLAQSISANGLVQPIVVRSTDNNSYELISGERRLRAVKTLGYETIPAIIKKDVSDSNSMLMALIENIQREDINPLEEAQAYEMIIYHHNYTQQQLSEVLGKSRSAITNTLRLLELSDMAKQALLTSIISEGHARVLLHYKDHSKQDMLLKQIIEKKLNVRDAERIINKSTKTVNKSVSKKLLTGCKFSVTYSKRKNSGNFVVNYNSSEQFEQIKNLLLNA